MTPTFRMSATVLGSTDTALAALTGFDEAHLDPAGHPFCPFVG